MNRFRVILLAGLLIVLTVCTGTASRNAVAEHSSAPGAPAPNTNGELTPIERAFIALQLVRGRHAVEVLIAAREGQAANVRHRLAAISGDVLQSNPEIGFVRASIPLPQVLEVMSWPEISIAQIDAGDEAALFAVDGPYENQGPTPNQNKPGRAPTAYTARDNPYTAERSTQSLQFKQAHPTYDGRGVVVGGIESVDIRTPSLSRAFSLAGAMIPKFADYVLPIPPTVAVEPIPEKGQADYGWQRTMTVDPRQDQRVSFNGKSYLIPESVKSDELRMALVRARPGPVRPNTKGLASEMAVLWAVRAGKVWMCEGEQTNFEQGIVFDPLPTLPHRPALARLPHGDNRTFMITVDVATRTLRLRYGSLYHGTMGASTAVGHSFLNSQAEGIAPGAQFLPIDFGSGLDQTTMQLPALIELFRDPRVDVITNSSGMGDTRRLVSARNVYRECVDRLGQRYSKIMFKSAGNFGPEGIKEVGLTNGSAVITVGAYTPSEAWEANFGITPTELHTPPSYSSYGPSLDGGLKPDLLSLTGTLCAAKPASSLKVFGASPYYEMPIDYGLSGGTSAATPNAAGHAALLVSAAKQEGIPYDSKRLKIALFSSCLFLDGVETRVQGHGLIQISDAWDVLRRIKNYVAPTFETEAPVRTYHSSEFIRPNSGRGIYERIGWAPGQSGDRAITITRTSGPQQSITYRLRWMEARRRSGTHVLNTPAFSSSFNEISLPLNQPVKIPVHIQIGESGAYSAILDLIDPDVGVVVHSVMCTIIAAEQLTSQNGHTVRVTRVAPHPGNGLVFVNVPPETAALRIQLKQTNGKLVTLNVRTPDGGTPKVAEGPDNVLSTWQLEPSAREDYDQTFTNPQPGVWQLWVDHENGWIDAYDPLLPRPAPPCEFTMTVSAIGGQWHSTQQPDSQIKVKFKGQLARINSPKVVALGLGTINERETVLPTGLPSVFYEVDVAPGTTKLRTSAKAETDGMTNISLIVFRISDENPKLSTTVGFDIGIGPQKEVELINPKPGRYKICLDAWGAAHTKSVRVRYREELYGPQYGRLAIAEASADKSDRAEALISWHAQPQTIKGGRLVAEVALLTGDCVNMSNVSTTPREGRPVQEGMTQSVPIAATTIILPQKR